MTTYGVTLSDSRNGSQAYLAKTATERFDEVGYREFTDLLEMAAFIRTVRGAKRYTTEGDWKDVPRRFVLVLLWRDGSPWNTVNGREEFLMSDLPAWVVKGSF